MSALRVPEEPGPRAAEIRAAAARIFAEKGYDATSVEDIAAAVGMLKGSLYHHIDSKQQLLFDVIAGAHARAMGNATALQQRSGSVASRLRAAIEEHIRFNLEERVDVSVFFDDFRSLDDGRRGLIAEERATYTALLQDLVEEGQATGELAADRDAGLTVLALLGLMNWVHRWFDPGGERSVDEIAAGLADLALHGLAVRGPGPAPDQ